MRARTEDLRQRALRVGARLFARSSYDATTTREISKAIGITNGTFHHHFPTKEDLLVAICERSYMTISRAGSGALDGVEGDEERLRTLIRTYVSVVLEDPPLHKTAVTDVRSLNPENRAKVDASFAVLTEQFGAIVRRGQESGALRADLADEDLVSLLVNLVTWSLLWTDRKEELDPAAVEFAASSIFLDGARAEKVKLRNA